MADTEVSKYQGGKPRDKSIPELIQKLAEREKEQKNVLKEIDTARGNIAKAIVSDRDLSLVQKERALNDLQAGRYDMLPEKIQKSPMMSELQQSHKALGHLRERIDSVGNQLKETVKKAIDMAKERDAATKQKVTSFFKGALTNFIDSIKKVAQFLHERNEQFRTGVKNAIEAYKDAGQKANEMARNGIAQGIKHIVELGNAAEEQISEKAKSAGTAAKEVTATATRSVREAGARLRNTADRAGSKITLYGQEQTANRAINRFVKKDIQVIDRHDKEMQIHNIKNAARDLIQALRTGERADPASQKDYQMSDRLQGLIDSRNKCLQEAQRATKAYSKAAEKSVGAPGVFTKGDKIKDLTGQIAKATLAASQAKDLEKISPIIPSGDSR